MPVPPRLSFHPVDQQVQLFGTKRGTGPLANRPAESSRIQSLGTYPQARTVIKENLQSVAQLVGKDEKMARGRFLLQHRLHPRVKAIETLAHVHWLQCNQNARCGGEVQHIRPSFWTNAPIHSALACEFKRKVTPRGNCSSAAQLLRKGTSVMETS